MNTHLKIAFLTSEDPNNRKPWSGIYYQMFKSLSKQFLNVVPLGPVKLDFIRYLTISIVKILNLLPIGKRYNVFHSKFLAKYYAKAFQEKLNRSTFDYIFAPSASVQIAFLKTSVPIIYYSDASFGQMKGYYNIFNNLFRFSEKESEQIQINALDNVDIVIHSSKWATDYAISHYKVKENKAFTISMGANIDQAPDLEVLKWKINNYDICNLLFLGVDWERKGGSIAYNTFLELTKLGLDCTLTICGCIPPKVYADSKVKIIPFLNKNDINQYNQFLEILTKTHFLLLPTRAECAGIVFAEASAYGIPSITTNTGGVGEMVENNINGFMLDFDDEEFEYANLINNVFTDRDRYEKLVYSSRGKFENQLNWNTWGEQVKKIIIDDYNNNRKF